MSIHHILLTKIKQSKKVNRSGEGSSGLTWRGTSTGNGHSTESFSSLSTEAGVYGRPQKLAPLENSTLGVRVGLRHSLTGRRTHAHGTRVENYVDFYSPALNLFNVSPLHKGSR